MLMSCAAEASTVHNLKLMACFFSDAYIQLYLYLASGDSMHVNAQVIQLLLHHLEPAISEYQYSIEHLID